ncbi:hypothetical protein CCACVL1_03122, partial [Corchorus capsularis]
PIQNSSNGPLKARNNKCSERAKNFTMD